MESFIGDCMPYYEDGVYYIYYLKEGGDSYHHSIYLLTTTDFITYEEYDDPVLTAGDAPAQDDWIGTGSLVKVDETYYLFYTGHTDSDAFEYGETIMLATGSDPFSFKKVDGWEITPDPSLGQKRDFRDPQVYYDEEQDAFCFTVTASQDGIARILKYTVSQDLTDISYDGIVFTDPIGKVYNLECSDTFQIGDTWYLTYSAQDDVLWYASSDEPYGPFSEPKPLDGPLFYAAKHVENGSDAYMVGWARRSRSAKDTRNVNAWAGNLLVQQMQQLEDGSLVLEPVDAVTKLYDTSCPLSSDAAEQIISSNDTEVYQEIFTSLDNFMLKGTFCFEQEGDFGLAFGFGDSEEDYKYITLSPDDQKMYLQFRGGETTPAQAQAPLHAGKASSFTYIQEDSVGVFYIDDETAFTVRLYGTAGKPVFLFARDNQVSFTDLALYTRSTGGT